MPREIRSADAENAAASLPPDSTACAVRALSAEVRRIVAGPERPDNTLKAGIFATWPMAGSLRISRQ